MAKIEDRTDNNYGKKGNLKMNKLYLDKRNEFGNERLYPLCRTSKLLARLSGTKTITDDNLKTIYQLGYTCFYNTNFGEKQIVLYNTNQPVN